VRTGRLPGVTVKPVVVGVSHERMDENFAAYIAPGKVAKVFCRWYMKSIYFPMFDHHIAVSEHTAGELIEASHGHKVRRGVWVSPMGVDCDRFTSRRRRPESRAELLRQFHAPPDATVILYAGRLSPEKNVGLLLDMAGRLDAEKFRLCIAGDGPLAAALREQCSRRGLTHVFFLGHVANREDLADLYANADAFVHPNPREPFGIAPLEAMSAGLPLIAPDTGGVTSYANAENAWLIHPDASSFADAARAIRENPQECARRIRHAQATASQFRWPTVTSQFLNLCRELIDITRDSRLAPRIAPRVWSKGSALDIPSGY
jgi:alpha-1,6-mannosyltransferase